MTDAIRHQIFDLIRKLTGRDSVIVIPRVFISLLDGDYAAAGVLNQVLYWSDRTSDPDGWFYKSYEEWYAETGLSQYQINRAINGDKRRKSGKPTLASIGVKTKLKKSPKGAPTVHYRLDREAFVEKLLSHIQTLKTSEAMSIMNIVDNPLSTMSIMDNQQSQQSYTEITPETTTIESDRAREVETLKPTPSEEETGNQPAQTETKKFLPPPQRKLFPLDAMPAAYDDGSPAGRETFRLEVHDVFYAYLEGFRLVNRSPLTSIDTLWNKHKSAAVKLTAAKIAPERVTAFVVEKYTDPKDSYWQNIDNLISLNTVGTQIRNWLARQEKPKQPVRHAPELPKVIELTDEQRAENLRKLQEAREAALNAAQESA